MPRNRSEKNPVWLDHEACRRFAKSYDDLMDWGRGHAGLVIELWGLIPAATRQFIDDAGRKDYKHRHRTIKETLGIDAKKSK